ncbi:hypothetical protein Q8A73_017227 [Channa argus]|nr:hypothetical protein Q8A73_017227 [Channa argus]
MATCQGCVWSPETVRNRGEETDERRGENYPSLRASFPHGTPLFIRKYCNSLDTSTLPDPLTESTLLAVGPCGWLVAKAAASVAFQDDSSSATCPVIAASFRAAVTLSS